jgi:hypothetical protein
MFADCVCGQASVRRVSKEWVQVSRDQEEDEEEEEEGELGPLVPPGTVQKVGNREYLAIILEGKGDMSSF